MGHFVQDGGERGGAGRSYDDHASALTPSRASTQYSQLRHYGFILLSSPAGDKCPPWLRRLSSKGLCINPVGWTASAAGPVLLLARREKRKREKKPSQTERWCGDVPRTAFFTRTCFLLKEVAAPIKCFIPAFLKE